MIVLGKDNNDFDQGTGITFGKFDGIHIGHREIIKILNEECKRINYKSVLYTFEQNPANVLNGSKIKYIYSQKRKKDILSSLEVDYLSVNDFNQYYAQTTPEDFIKMLIDRFNVKLIAVGYNSRFGACRNGGLHELGHLCKKYNIDLKILPEVTYKVDNKIYDVSSTVIREIISEGDVKLAGSLLGTFFSIEGLVVEGFGRGKDVGFRTMNMMPEEGLILPKDGVYITVTKLDKLYNSITNIGVNPTFNRQNRMIETHLLDSDIDLYGQTPQVFFVEKIRSEKKFKSLQDLSNQIANDVKVTNRYFEGFNQFNKII